MNVNCYAFRSGSECKILENNSRCGKHCSFRKTEEELIADRQKALNMLASLSFEMQLYISDKYYQGKRPWLKKYLNHD